MAGGNAAASGEDAVGGDHTAEIFRAGFDAGQYDVLALSGQFLGLGSRENDRAGSRTGAGGQARGHQAAFLLGCGVGVAVENRLEQLGSKASGITRLDRVFRRHQLFFHHVVRDLDVSSCGPLAVPRFAA